MEPRRDKRGEKEKKKKKKPLDRSSTKGFSSSQSLNLTSQTKWIPFAWLLVGPLVQYDDGNGLNVYDGGADVQGKKRELLY